MRIHAENSRTQKEIRTARGRLRRLIFGSAGRDRRVAGPQRGALYDLAGSALRTQCAEALELVGLAERANDNPETFSGGMKRRLNIACALVHRPDLLLLDEPTVGVDPQSRNALFENLETLRAQGRTLVYTTHYMEEAERLCDHIVIVDHGKVVASDTLQGLYRSLPAFEPLEVEVDGPVDTAALLRETGITTAQQDDSRLTLGIADLTRSAPQVLQWLAARGHRIRHVASGRATLENVFLALTGHRLRD